MPATDPSESEKKGRPGATFFIELSVRSGGLITGCLADRLVNVFEQFSICLPDRQVVGDGGTKCLWVMGIVAHLVEHQQSGAQVKTFLQIVGHHEDGGAGFLPEFQ